MPAQSSFVFSARLPRVALTLLSVALSSSCSVDGGVAEQQSDAMESPSVTSDFDATRPYGETQLGEGAFHSYSKIQAFNANETLVNMTGGAYGIYNLSGELLYQTRMNSNSRWHPSDPDVLVGVFGDEPTHFGTWNVVSGEVNRDLYVGSSSLSIGDGEGEIARNGNVVLKEGSKLISLNVFSGEVLGQKEGLVPDHNWSGFSRSGKFIVEENNAPSGSGEEYFEVFNADFSYRGRVTMDQYEHEHGDFAESRSGRDYYVMLGAALNKVDLETLEIRQFSADNIWVNGHISGRMTGERGMMLVSSHDGMVGDSPYHIGLFDIDSTFEASYIQVAEMSTSYNDYERSSKATISPSGRYIIRTSDQGNSGGAFHDYLLAQPAAPERVSSEPEGEPGDLGPTENEGSDLTTPQNVRGSVYSSSALEVFWDRHPDPKVIAYEVLRNGEKISERRGISFFEGVLEADREYSYSIVALAADGTRSLASSPWFGRTRSR